MKNLKLYLDMDGVLCDFEKKYKELFGKTPLEARNNKEFSPNWEQFIREKQFEKLDWNPGAMELLNFIHKHPIFQVEILSSSGGEKFHGEVTAQKIKWLRTHSIHYKANIVPGRKYKSEYAKGDTTILIDDTEDIIHNFNKTGGIGILHKNVGQTLKRLKEILESD